MVNVGFSLNCLVGVLEKILEKMWDGTCGIVSSELRLLSPGSQEGSNVPRRQQSLG